MKITIRLESRLESPWEKPIHVLPSKTSLFFVVVVGARLNVR